MPWSANLWGQINFKGGGVNIVCRAQCRISTNREKIPQHAIGVILVATILYPWAKKLLGGI
jgi:hypothetical protein